MSGAPTALLTALWVVSSALPAIAGEDAILYDVDFSSPPHTLGSEPVFAGGPRPRNTPSSEIIILATATVVASSNGLTDQPVELATGTCSGSCISNLNFDTFEPELPEFRLYTLTGTLVVDPTATTGNGGAAVFADVFGQGFVLRFHADGSITAGRPAFEVSVGTYTLGEPLSFEISVDVVQDEWTASVDGSELYGEPIPDAALHRFRIVSYANGASLPGSTGRAAFDDVVIRVRPPRDAPALGALGLVVVAGLLSGIGLRRLRAA